jgi:hypothetical protein
MTTPEERLKSQLAVNLIASVSILIGVVRVLTNFIKRFSQNHIELPSMRTEE